jgi:hypothetical protein
VLADAPALGFRRYKGFVKLHQPPLVFGTKQRFERLFVQPNATATTTFVNSELFMGDLLEGFTTLRAPQTHIVADGCFNVLGVLLAKFFDEFLVDLPKIDVFTGLFHQPEFVSKIVFVFIHATYSFRDSGAVHSDASSATQHGIRSIAPGSPVLDDAGCYSPERTGDVAQELSPIARLASCIVTLASAIALAFPRSMRLSI